MTQLPAGWRWVELGKVISEAQSGFATGERDLEGVIQIRMNNVNTQGNLNWNNFIRVPTSNEQLARYELKEGDILFNNTNSTELVGKSALFRTQNEPIVYSNHFTRLRTIPNELDPSFLVAWLRRQWETKVFEQICNRWIGQSAVKADKLLTLKIPLPPLEEQRRIVAILDEKMAAIERARAAAEVQLKAAKALPAAYLREVFESQEAKGWSKRRLGDINRLLPAKSIALAGDTDVNVITTACLTEAGFNPNGIKSSKMWSYDVAECVVSKGEILIARSNTTELVGRVAMFDGDPSGVVASDLTIRVWPCQEQYIPSFLASYLSSLYLNGYWHDRAGGASQSMKKITRGMISNIQVPTPDIETQKSIVVLFNEKINKVKQVDKDLQAQLAAINDLPAAYLGQAFKGEL